MKKKIVSYLMTVMLLLSYAAAPAGAEYSDTGKAQLLYALDIIDSDISELKSSNAPLTRADAAYYALRVSGRLDIPEFGGEIFSDVTADTARAAAINYCASLGIVAMGDSYQPDSAVTLAQMYKMIETALGYEPVAAMLGGWTKGYTELAKQLLLDDGFRGMQLDSPLSYAHLEAILVNAVMSPSIEIADYSGGGEYRLNNKENVLYKVFDVYKAYGKVSANAATTLLAPVGVGTDTVVIGNVKYKTVHEVYPALARELGYEVDAWVRQANADRDEEIIGFARRNGIKEQIIDADDFVSLSGGVLRYKSGSRNKTENLPADCSIIYNGKAADRELDSDIFKNRWGSAVMLSEGSRVTAVIFTAYDNYFAGNIDKENFVCYDNTVNNRSISFADGDELSELAYFSDNAGNTLSFDDISAGCVLSVAQNGNYYDCVIVKESVTGTLGQMTTDGDGKTEAYVDNNTYMLSPEMALSRAAQLKLGNKYTFYLDVGGKIAAARLVSSDTKAMSWVYLLRTGMDNEASKAVIRVLTASDDTSLLRLADRVKIDGTVYKEITEEELTELFMRSNTPSTTLKQPIKIAVNESGEITNIDTIYFDNGNENRNDSARRFYNDERSDLYFKRNAFGMQVSYNANTVVFCAPQSDDSDPIALGTDAFVIDVKYNISAYNSDKNSRTAEVIVCTNAVAAATPMWMQDYITVVSDITTGVNSDNDVETKIVGYQNGSRSEWTVESEDTLKIGTAYLSDKSGAIKLGKGDAIRFSTNNKGEINNIQLIYDCSERKYRQPSSIPGDTSDGIARLGPSYQRMQIGMVMPYYMSDTTLVSATDVLKAPDDVGQEYIVNNLSTFKIYVVDARGSAGEVKVGSKDDIRDWYNYGVSSDIDVLMRCRYDEGRDIVIYKY